MRLSAGYDFLTFTGPKYRSYTGLTHPDDLEPVLAAVDAALATRSNWGVDCRIRRADCSEIRVHEIGGGVYDGTGLLYLESDVIDSDGTR